MSIFLTWLRRIALPATCAALCIITGRPSLAQDAARNVAPLATVTASAASENTSPSMVTDGKMPTVGCRDDQGEVWIVKGSDVPATLTFTWKQPTQVATVVYYERTTWGFEYFKDYEIYIDDAATPVCKGTFVKGEGPQLVNLPQPVLAHKLTMKFLSYAGGNPGAAEVQIFTAPPPASALLCRFSDYTMDFRYAYYPSHNLVRALVPTPPAAANAWQIAVRAAGSDKIIAARGGTLPMAAAGEELKVPDLPEGRYMLRLTLTGGAQPVIEERGFERRHFEWEGQKLGQEDVVIPPFTPLKVDARKRTVDAVLRTYTMNDAGLWDQVNSHGEDILAAPVRLEVTSGGKTFVAKGTQLRFAEAKDTHVNGSASWSAGPLTGRTSFAYDYDGLQQLTLELDKTTQPIDRLQLVIPLKAAEAWLMHPVTDTLRHHYAGLIPDGQGKVWDSLRISRESLPGPFVPYIYVGGPERGICYAADNDRDWIIDAREPAIEIDRDGTTVNLRLNLIAHPAQLTRQRTITLALQATPTKPMPEQPYNWRRWYTTGTDQNADDVQIAFWGGNRYWGGHYFASSFFPAFKDYSFWEQLADNRRTGKQDPAYLDKWLAQFTADSKDDQNDLRACAHAGLEWATYTPLNTADTKKFRYLIPYTNARGCTVENPDFLTYLDEWVTGDIADPKWKNFSDFERPKHIDGFGCWYDCEPVNSRIDMMLYYAKKMYETFADGIYWDNCFLASCYVPNEAGGPAYVGDDGKLHPGVNLMGFRNLVKRNAVMMYEMGKRPLSYVHMTNANIVPMLSFGTLQLDWEWRDQGDNARMDLQDRLGSNQDTGLILAQSLGLQAGNINVAIDRFNPPPNSGTTREWLFRTVMAICMPHEIKVYQGTQSVSYVQDQMAAFGYGQPDCKVYRYWEPGYPLTAEGAKIHALVLSHGPKAMLAIGNYGPGDQPAQATAAPQTAPTLADYDAAQRGLGPNTAAPPAPAPPAGDRRPLCRHAQTRPESPRPAGHRPRRQRGNEKRVNAHCPRRVHLADPKTRFRAGGGGMSR